MDADPAPDRGRMLLVAAAGLMSAMLFFLSPEYYLQGSLTWLGKPLQIAMQLWNFGLTAAVIDVLFPGLPFKGQLVAGLAAVCLAGVGILDAGLVFWVLAMVVGWRLLTSRSWTNLLPRQPPPPAVEGNDDHQPLAILEQLGAAMRVGVLVARDGARYLWLTSTPDAANDDGPDLRYVLTLIPERRHPCLLPLKFIRGNTSFTWYTSVQTLTIKASRGLRTECLGLCDHSLKSLQDALSDALVPKQCSTDKPPYKVVITNDGPEVLKDERVIRIGRVGQGSLVVRLRDLVLDMGGTRVLALRAIYFVLGTNADLTPPAAQEELQRYQDSLQAVIYQNVLRPFMEFTANPAV